MIDFIKLRNLIIEKKCVSSNDYGKEDPFIGIYWEDLIDIINHCDSTKWISVDEELPEENKLGDSDFVFVKTSIRYPFLACYSYKHETWKDINHIAIHGVTHWTPIPELKGGEE